MDARPRIRLIASDIDGTLLDPHAGVPEQNYQALRAAADAGVQLMLATIRKRDSAEPFAHAIGRPCTLVCEGGAVVYSADGATLHESAIPIELAAAVADLADAERLDLVTTIASQNYYRRDAITERWPGDRARLVERHRDALAAAPTRLIARGERACLLVLERLRGAPLRMVRHLLDGRLTDVVITAPDVTKERGVALACAPLGLRLADVLAIGDAEADVELLRAAGVGVAVANAVPEALAAADWVAPSCAEGGVAAAVRRFALPG